MTRGRSRLAFWTAVIAWGGCAEAETDGSTAPASTVRDSAGVVIVENERPGEGHRLEWTLGNEPSTTIGTLEGDERYQLFRVIDALVLEDRRIAVANRGTSEIRVYDERGEYLTAWGGEGEGPGEFTGLGSIDRWEGDSLLAWDFRARRLTVFDAEGALGRTFQLASDERVAVSELVDVMPDGQLLIRGSFLFGGDDPASGLQRLPRPYALAGPTGEITSGLGDHDGAETYALISPEFVMVMTHPFARTTVEAVWGGLPLLAASDRYELTSYDATGALVRSVRSTHTPVPVTDGHLTAFVDSRLEEVDEERRQQISQQYEDMPLVASFPAFDELHVDAADHLWVRDYVAPPDEGHRWTVFSPEGRVLGWIEIPHGLDVMEIGDDYLLASTRDDLDVEYVQLWSLTRG